MRRDRCRSSWWMTWAPFPFRSWGVRMRSGRELSSRGCGSRNRDATLQEVAMTAKADFTPEEWEVVLEGPPGAGMIVLTAQRGGTFRETVAMAKAYAEARKQHGESQLLDEIVSAKPEIDHTRHHSVEELKDGALRHVRDAVALLERKATPEELEDYRRFVLTVAERVATAHREDGVSISPAEQAAIQEIAACVGAPAP